MAFDKIFLRRLVVFARVDNREPELCSLEVDMEASIDLGPASSSDNLSDTADYASLAREISAALGVSRHADLAEAANAVVDILLLRESKIHEVLLTLRDPRAVLGVAIGDVSTSVTRKRRST